MARRRMFEVLFIDADAFLDMPATSQLLYFHLGMRADDDGFIHNPKSVMRSCGGTEDDLKILIAKKYLIPFESGIVVIKHWKIHNQIPKDRYKETHYKAEKAQLTLDEKGAYTLCIQNVNKMDTQVSIGKGSIGQVSVVEVSESGNRVADNNGNDEDDEEETVDRLEVVGGRIGKGVVLLTQAQFDSLLDELGLGVFEHYVEKLATFIIEKGATVKNHYETIRKWVKEDSKVGVK